MRTEMRNPSEIVPTTRNAQSINAASTHQEGETGCGVPRAQIYAGDSSAKEYLHVIQ